MFVVSRLFKGLAQCDKRSRRLKNLKVYYNRFDKQWTTQTQATHCGKGGQRGTEEGHGHGEVALRAQYEETHITTMLGCQQIPRKASQRNRKLGTLKCRSKENRIVFKLATISILRNLRSLPLRCRHSKRWTIDWARLPCRIYRAEFPVRYRRPSLEGKCCSR